MSTHQTGSRPERQNAAKRQAIYSFLYWKPKTGSWSDSPATHGDGIKMAWIQKTENPNLRHQ